MKALTLSLTILLTGITYAMAADFTSIKNGDQSIVSTKAKILSVNHHSDNLVPGTKVEIQVTFSGCLDRLAGYNYFFKEVDGKGIIFFNALSLANKASISTSCFVANHKKISIFVPFEGDIELKTLNFVGGTI
ncbi:MAG: hypothetical protein KBD76_01675 [Bacteriovorax sp.]|nr:hypothetical protein [Bacteriovorax sp.]